MPPQGQPPQGAPQGEEGGEGDEQAIVELGKALAALAQAKPEFGEIADAFAAVVEEMMAGGGPPKGPAGPPVSPEAGGNPNAKPAGF